MNLITSKTSSTYISSLGLSVRMDPSLSMKVINIWKLDSYWWLIYQGTWGDIVNFQLFTICVGVTRQCGYTNPILTLNLISIPCYKNGALYLRLLASLETFVGEEKDDIVNFHTYSMCNINITMVIFWPFVWELAKRVVWYCQSSNPIYV